MIGIRRRLCSAMAAAVVVLSLTGLAAPVQAQGALQQSVETPQPDRARARMNARVFDRVWSMVRRDYYDPHLHGVDWNAAREQWRPLALAATDDCRLYAALGGMLDLLDDDHAGAIPPAVARRQEAENRSRAVLGLSLMSLGDGQWRIERVRAGSPADQAQVREGWLLDADDNPDWSPDRDVVEGLAVVLNLADEAGERRIVSLTPVVMPPVPPFVMDRSRPDVAVVRIDRFDPGLGRWLGGELANLSPETGLVIDLRGNPGGRLIEAEALLSCFLPRNQPWASRISRSGRTVVLRAAQTCGGRDGPVANRIAVLVDGASRSAAELTPAALQEAGRAVIVGRKTAGAVLISHEARLPDGGRLTLSRADFVTTGGVRLEKRGVTPDIQAETSPDDRRARRDPALEAAISLLRAPA